MKEFNGQEKPKNVCVSKISPPFPFCALLDIGAQTLAIEWLPALRSTRNGK
jgi:hypothetical protein